MASIALPRGAGRREVAFHPSSPLAKPRRSTSPLHPRQRCFPGVPTGTTNTKGCGRVSQFSCNYSRETIRKCLVCPSHLPQSRPAMISPAEEVFQRRQTRPSQNAIPTSVVHPAGSSCWVKAAFGNPVPGVWCYAGDAISVASIGARVSQPLLPPGQVFALLSAQMQSTRGFSHQNPGDHGGFYQPRRTGIPRLSRTSG